MRKNLFFTIAIILIVNSISAQKTRFGITAGPVASTMITKMYKSGKGLFGTSYNNHTAQYRYGATAGILLDVPMQKGGSFQPGLNFVTKGMREEFVQGNQKGTLETNFNYLEVTLNVVFRIKHANNNMVLGVGAVPSLPLSGKEISDVANSQGKKTLEFGDKTTDNYNGTDFGADALVGYEFANNLFITFNYYYGFNRQFVGGDPKDKLYHRYFALRLGYLFGKK